MISFALPARNSPENTNRALLTLAMSVRELGWQSNVNILLLDDASDPKLQIPVMFKQFALESALPTRVVRFHQNQHYSRVLSAALSFSTGEKVFFLSNDMIFTPSYFKTLVDVSDLDPSIGIVRGTSTFVDSHPEHCIRPPFPPRNVQDVNEFAKYVSTYWQQTYSEDNVLSADAVLFNRRLIDAIGAVDTRYFGYFGDVDYGIRAMRAGFKLVCAKGAWLFHEGGGYVRDEINRQKLDESIRFSQRMAVVQRAYDQYRMKWKPELPVVYSEVTSEHWQSVKQVEPPDRHKYFPPIVLTPDLGEYIA